MTNKTAAECELERLLLTAKEEYQTLKNEEKDVVIRGKSLARIYRQLIDVIGQLKAERKRANEMEAAFNTSRVSKYMAEATQFELLYKRERKCNAVLRTELGDIAVGDSPEWIKKICDSAFEQEAEIRGEV